jgi:hypothetical protein
MLVCEPTVHLDIRGDAREQGRVQIDQGELDIRDQRHTSLSSEGAQHGAIPQMMGRDDLHIGRISSLMPYNNSLGQLW